MVGDGTSQADPSREVLSLMPDSLGYVDGINIGRLGACAEVGTCSQLVSSTTERRQTSVARGRLHLVQIHAMPNLPRAKGRWEPVRDVVPRWMRLGSGIESLASPRREAHPGREADARQETVAGPGEGGQDPTRIAGNAPAAGSRPSMPPKPISRSVGSRLG